jgi:cell wall-associated NlpC family hydrolase
MTASSRITRCTDLRVTTDDLPPGLPAARRAASAGGTLRLLCLAGLLTAGTWAQAQEAATAVPAALASDVSAVAIGDALVANAPAAPAASPAPAPVVQAPVAVAPPSVRERATSAAAATLTALLPRLASNDAIPLMDRSALFASDLSRLLSDHSLSPADALVSREEGGKVQSVLKRALTLLGTPYRWGGTSPDSGFDCSGLVGYVFRSALGIELPRISRDMASKSDAELIKSREDLQQGDLVFFGRKGRVNHVGIYVGEGQFLHSPSQGKDVRVDSLVTGYWGNRFMQARRLAM